MSLGLFEKLPLSHCVPDDDPPDVFLITASGEILDSVGYFKVTFLMDHVHSYTWSFYVLPTLIEPCILGLDFMSAKGFNLKGRTKQVTYRYEGKKHVIRTDSFAPCNSIQAVKEELKINIGNFDSPSQEAAIRELVLKHRKIIAVKMTELGRAVGVKHAIKLTPGPPVRLPLRRMPLTHRPIAEKFIKEMLLARVIRPSISPFSAPIHMVPKDKRNPLGPKRFCVDYRRLNKRTIFDPYPLPRIDEILDTLGGATIFSSLDLHLGYWQVELDENDKEKTAFTSHLGHFEFNVLSFGLCNAPPTFQRLMNNALRPALGHYAICYLDDVLIFSKDFDSHLKHIASVFDLLEKAGLKLQLPKCLFLRLQLRYLGYLISKHGVTPDPERVSPILNLPAPTNVELLKSYLGCCSFYRRYIRNYSTIAEPLTKLGRDKEPWVWGPEQETAFQTLKNCLMSPPILRFADPTLPYILDTDASATGIGSVLSQIQTIDGIEQEAVIAYASKTLSTPERKWSTIEREMFAIVHAVRKFQHYLYGSRISIRSDHKPLSHLLNLKDATGRLGRWALRLQELDAQIEYRPGKMHANADFLSRIPPSADDEPESPRDSSQPLTTVHSPIYLVTAEIAAAQQTDDYCKKLIKLCKQEPDIEPEEAPPEASLDDQSQPLDDGLDSSSPPLSARTLMYLTPTMTGLMPPSPISKYSQMVYSQQQMDKS